MNESIITRRQLLATAVVIPLPGLLHRQAGKDVFTIPSHAWHALASAALTTRRVVIGQDISAGSAGIIASLISDCPGELSYYRDLYFGIHEAMPEIDAGRLWFDDVRRLKRLCVFLGRGGCVVEQDDEWTVLTRRNS
jgi:hypothetical protein